MTVSDLITEAEQLWAAERLGKPNGRICANWGSVALLCRPDRDIPQDILDAWAGHVSGDQDYGHIPQAGSESRGIFSGCVGPIGPGLFLLF